MNYQKRSCNFWHVITIVISKRRSALLILTPINDVCRTLSISANAAASIFLGRNLKKVLILMEKLLILISDCEQKDWQAHITPMHGKVWDLQSQILKEWIGISLRFCSSNHKFAHSLVVSGKHPIYFIFPALWDAGFLCGECRGWGNLMRQYNTWRDS